MSAQAVFDCEDLKNEIFTCTTTLPTPPPKGPLRRSTTKIEKDNYNTAYFSSTVNVGS